MHKNCYLLSVHFLNPGNPVNPENTDQDLLTTDDTESTENIRGREERILFGIIWSALSMSMHWNTVFLHTVHFFNPGNPVQEYLTTNDANVTNKKNNCLVNLLSQQYTCFGFSPSFILNRLTY